MEFYDWPGESSQSFISDLLVLSIPGVEADDNAVLWNDYAWNNFNDSLPILASDDFFDTSGSSRSNGDASPSQRFAIDDENTSKSKTTDRQAVGSYCKRDTTLNRIQRRRTQNRNSQRLYRQRRIDERMSFENRAIAAEETSSQMGRHLRELQSMVTSLGHKIHQLEAENLALRTSTYSMPWRKPSMQL